MLNSKNHSNFINYGYTPNKYKRIRYFKQLLLILALQLGCFLIGRITVVWILYNTLFCVASIALYARWIKNFSKEQIQHYIVDGTTFMLIGITLNVASYQLAHRFCSVPWYCLLIWFACFVLVSVLFTYGQYRKFWLRKKAVKSQTTSAAVITAFATTSVLLARRMEPSLWMLIGALFLVSIALSSGSLFFMKAYLLKNSPK